MVNRSGYKEYKFKSNEGKIGIIKIGWFEIWGCDVSYIFEDGSIENETWESKEDIIFRPGEYIELK